MPYQKQAFTAVITSKLSHAGLCILTLLLWCVTPSSPASLATGVNSSSTHADQREALLPLATQSHSLRIRNSKALIADTNDAGMGDAVLPAYAAQVVIAHTASCALPRSITPRTDNLFRCLPPSRAPPAA